MKWLDKYKQGGYVPCYECGGEIPMAQFGIHSGKHEKCEKFPDEKVKRTREGKERPSDVVSPYEEISNIKYFDKDQQKAMNTQYTELLGRMPGLSKDDFTAMYRDSVRTNRSIIRPDYEKYFNKGALRPEYQNIKGNFTPAHLYYKERFPQGMTVEGALQYHNQPGMPAFSNIVNSGYKPQNQYGGNIPSAQFKQGGIIKDDLGYWNAANHGKMVEINSPNITMKGVSQPLLGVSNTGDVQYMTPGNDYNFDGERVTEIPMAQNGNKEGGEKNKFNTKLKGNASESFNYHSELFPSLLNDSFDYDTKGFYKQIYDEYNGDLDAITKALTPNSPTQHIGTDRYKKPNHPTFSNESKYSIPIIRPGGKWGHNKKEDYYYFKATRRNIKNMNNSDGSPINYFKRAEDPDVKLFFRNEPVFKQGGWLNKYAEQEGNLPMAQTGETIYSSDKKRVQAYQDSLDLYNATEYQKKLVGNKGNIFLKPQFFISDLDKDGLNFYGVKKRSLIQTLKDDFTGKEPFFIVGEYEKATGKSAYHKRDKNKPNDTAVIDYINSLQNNNLKVINRTSPEFYHNTIEPEYYYIAGDGPINQSFKKPVQPVVYRKPQPKPQQPIKRIVKEVEKPVTSEPKVQDITPTPQKSIIPEQQQGKIVYGPTNAAIGYMTKNGFEPIKRRDHLAKSNQAEIDLLNNPEALKQYMKNKTRQ